MHPKPTRIAIFASVSSPRQASIEKDSLPGQLRDGRAWADSIAAHVVATFQVPGHTRRDIFFQDAERDIPAYRALRHACEKRSFDVLWCRERSRLGRTDALIAQVEALVANAGAEVYSAAIPHQIGHGSDAGAIYLSAIERATAQTENITRVRHHERGMKARVRRGLPASQWAYGYAAIRDDTGRTIGGEFTPQIAAVRLATGLYLQGDGYDNIAAALDASPWTPKSAPRWRFATIRKMLLNDFYAGYVTYGEARNDHPSDKYPALWDPDTHQAIVQERARRCRGGKPPASAISGVAICARCGWKMVARRHRGRLYYSCAKHNCQRRWGPCHCNWTDSAGIFSAIETTIQALALPGAIETALITAGPDRTALQSELGAAQGVLQAVETKRQRLALALADGKMTADIYRTTDDQLIEELERAAAHLIQTQTRLASLPSIEERRAALETLIIHPDWLRTGPIQQTRAALLQSGLRVLVENGQIVETIISLE